MEAQRDTHACFWLLIESVDYFWMADEKDFRQSEKKEPFSLNTVWVTQGNRWRWPLIKGCLLGYS